LIDYLKRISGLEKRRGFSIFSQIFNSDPTQKLQQISETDKSWALEFKLKRESLVYTHSSKEVLSYDDRHQFLWELENSVELLISMKSTYTTEDATQLSIAQRRCIFPNERPMNFHETDEKYSLSACMKECRMNRAIGFCNCIPPFYVRKHGTNKVPYCTIANMTCINDHTPNITDITKCSHCELSCENTVYDIEKFLKTYVPMSYLSSLTFFLLYY
jgi:acid-sensing ion channel, other